MQELVSIYENSREFVVHRGLGKELGLGCQRELCTKYSINIYISIKQSTIDMTKELYNSLRYTFGNRIPNLPTNHSRLLGQHFAPEVVADPCTSAKDLMSTSVRAKF